MPDRNRSCMSTDPSQNILPADPRARRRAIAWIVVLGISAAVAVLVSQSYLSSLADLAVASPELAVERVHTLLTRLAYVGGLSLFAMAVWIGGLSRQALAERRFPPSTAKMVRDTPVVTGAAASFRACVGLACATMFVVCSVLLPVSLLSIADLLERSVH